MQYLHRIRNILQTFTTKGKLSSGQIGFNTILNIGYLQQSLRNGRILPSFK